ncbi:MAG: AEC family transporter [Bacilli bacterium]|nr:AEC family transporter [Bacilli bacterium]
MFFIDSSIADNIGSALSSMSLWTAVAKSVLIILVGFTMTKLRIFPENTGKILSKIVMKVALPCLAFGAFMTTITTETFNSAIFSFFYGFFIYVAFIFLAKLIFKWVKDPTQRKVLEILFVFGSTTFFGQPLINAVFPAAYNDSNMFNIAYRVFLYSYAYISICNNDDATITDTSLTEKKKSSVGIATMLKRIFVNPIIIATLVGFVLWALQLIPGSTDVNNWWVISFNEKTGVFWNIQISLPWLYNTVKTIGGLSSPLVWIAIGCTLGKVSFKAAVGDKKVWAYCLIKVLVGPILNFVLLLLINMIPVFNVTFTTVAATTIMWAVPPATVAVTYCINSDKCATFASSCSLLSTLTSVVFIPVYMILLTIVQSAGIFA